MEKRKGLMSTTARRLISIALDNGYQISEGALRTIYHTEDPLGVMEGLVSYVAQNDPQALMIDENHVNTFLETMRRSKTSVATVEKEEPATEETPIPRESAAALEYTSDIEIIELSREEQKIQGNVEEFRRYFHDRYVKIRNILEKRRERFLPLADAIESKDRDETAVVVSVYGKRETKRAVIIDVEDPATRFTVTIPRSRLDIVKRSETVIPDQVIGLRLRKIGESLMVEDIFQPDVPAMGQKKLAGVPPLSTVLISDLHVGSKNFDAEAFERFLRWIKGEEDGEDEAARVKYLVIAGDVVDGVGIYPGQESELELTSVEAQLSHAADLLAEIPSHIETFFSPGNHDPARKALPQLPLPVKYQQILARHRKITFIGNPSKIRLHRRELLIYHGQSFDDIIQTLPIASYSNLKQNVGAVLKTIIKARHLAPEYGKNTAIIPVPNDPLVIDEPPDVLATGHIHVATAEKYKGIGLVNSGCWQSQTEYQKALGLVPTDPSAVIVDLDTLDMRIKYFPA